MEWELIHHVKYSSNLAPSDYHFNIMHHFLSGQKPIVYDVHFINEKFIASKYERVYYGRTQKFLKCSKEIIQKI